MKKEGKQLQGISDLKAAPYNPRKISAEAMAGLKVSIAQFGDISGIVWNQRTGHLVSGHQRLASLKALYGGELVIDGECLSAPDGTAFPIRVVDWPLEMEKQANLAANNPHIGGEFDGSVGALLEAIRDEDSTMFEALRLGALAEDLGSIPPDFEPTGADEQPRLDQKAPVTCPRCSHEFIP
jgi:hypothetical protein